MSSRDPSSVNQFKKAFKTQTVAAAATVNGAEIDTKGWEWALFVINGGTNGSTADDVTFKIFSAPAAGGSYTLIAGTTITVLGADDDLEKSVQVNLDAVDTGAVLRVEIVGGTTAGWEVGVSYFLSMSKDTRVYTPTTATLSV